MSDAGSLAPIFSLLSFDLSAETLLKLEASAEEDLSTVALAKVDESLFRLDRFAK
jgi:hypothetical protein